ALLRDDRSPGYLVRLSDVGHAELGAADERSLVRFNGLPAVSVGIIKQATANPLEISAGLEEALPSIRALLPEGLEVAVAN
ncbi:efflux RND transporter permease subunit, partial [Rhizobium ruizarguesonis]